MLVLRGETTSWRKQDSYLNSKRCEMVDSSISSRIETSLLRDSTIELLVRESCDVINLEESKYRFCRNECSEDGWVKKARNISSHSPIEVNIVIIMFLVCKNSQKFFR